MTGQADMHFMQLALAQAKAGAIAGEVPVGAVVVKDGEVIASAHNAPLRSKDPTAHAEINALRIAAQALGNYRLEGCTLYVTLEPCAMCAGAIAQSRVKTLIFGAWDEKAGAVGSVWDVLRDPRSPHRTEVISGILEKECADILAQFFKTQRDQ